MIDQILITDMTQDEWTDSAENEPDELPFLPGMPVDDDFYRGEGDLECASIFEQVEQAPLAKPTGKCVTLDNNGVEWQV